MSSHKKLVPIVLLLLAFVSCKKDASITPEQQVENALDQFVASLVSNPPTTANASARVKQYMQTIAVPPQYFYGSTLTLLDAAGIAHIARTGIGRVIVC